MHPPQQMHTNPHYCSSRSWFNKKKNKIHTAYGKMTRGVL